MPKYANLIAFSLEINFERARICNYGICRLGSSLKNIYYNDVIFTASIENVFLAVVQTFHGS